MRARPINGSTIADAQKRSDGRNGFPPSASLWMMEPVLPVKSKKSQPGARPGTLRDLHRGGGFPLVSECRRRIFREWRQLSDAIAALSTNALKQSSWYRTPVTHPVKSAGLR
jgi:hypothetical protein